MRMYSMAGAESNKYKAAKTKISMKNNETPPNLLKNFAREKPNHETHISNPEQQDLNLILSLGRNYSENSKEKGIARASSVSGFEKAVLPECFLSLSRCSSLPAEIEIEKEQRKELQSMKRMEVKKRLTEKQRNSFRADEKFPIVEVVAPPLSSPDDVAAWSAVAAAKNPALCRAIFKIKASEYLPENRKIEEGQGGLASTSPPPIGSHSLRTLTSIEPMVSSSPNANENLFKVDETKINNPSKKCKVSSIHMQENGMDVMRRMPSVSTTGDGPNGRKIEGFLYTYLRGQVSIVCVCHGSFLTPAEFVKHAGGKDVANPMKHINVCTAFFSS